MSKLPNVQITSASSMRTRIPSLASIYQAKKSGDNSVEVLKQKFQTDIEHKIQHVQQQKGGMKTPPNKVAEDGPRSTLEFHQRGKNIASNMGSKRIMKTSSESFYGHETSGSQIKRHSIAPPTQRPPLPPPLPPTMKNRVVAPELSQTFSTTADTTAKGSETLRKLEREKSFEDARNAVQSQIEKIFHKQNYSKRSDQLNTELNSVQNTQLNGTNQHIRRHDAVIGMGTPTLPGIFPSKNQVMGSNSHSRFVGNEMNIEQTGLNDHTNNNYRSSMNIRNKSLPPPPPPLPPDIPLHSLDILQKRMIVESSIGREPMRPNMSSLSTKHRSMDSLVTAKITTPDTMDYLSPPISPSRRYSPNSKLNSSRHTVLDSQLNGMYGFKGKHNSSSHLPLSSRSSFQENTVKVHHQPTKGNENIARRDLNRYKQQRRDMQEMRRSVSHNSLAMQSNSQKQVHHLVQQDPPFQLHPKNSVEIQSRRHHPNAYYKLPEKHLLEGHKSTRHNMLSSYPSDGGTTANIGPMSMFGDFSIDPSSQESKMQYSQLGFYKGN